MTSSIDSYNIDDLVELQLQETAKQLQEQRKRLRMNQEWLQSNKVKPESSFLNEPAAADDADDPVAFLKEFSNQFEKESNESVNQKETTYGERLMNKGKEYLQNRKDRKKKLLREWKKEETYEPKLNRTSKLIFREEPVEERLHRLNKIKQEKINLMKREIEDNDYHSFEPEITKKGKDLKRSKDLAEISDHWLESREKKIEAERRRVKEEEESLLTTTPKLNSRTLKLVNSIKQRKKRQGKVEDYLYKLDQQKRKSLKEKEEKLISQQIQETPKITRQAATMVRGEPISERLFGMASILKEKKQLYKAEKRLQEESYQYHPSISKFGYSQRDGPIFADLLERDEQAKLKKIQKMEMLIEKERELHHPKINPVSEEIASRLPETSKERLLKQKKYQEAPDPLVQYSFKPQICKKSRSIENEKGQRPSLEQRIQHMYIRDKKRQEKVESLRQMYEEKEMEECTFAPKTSARNDDEQKEDLSIRMKKWEQRRAERIEKKRRKVVEKEMEACTFIPNKNRQQSDDRSVVSTTIMVEKSTPPPSGYQEFIARQHNARMMKENSQKGIFMTGKGWKNTVTVPQEFKLGKSRSRNRRSNLRDSQVKSELRKQIHSLAVSDEEEEYSIEDLYGKESLEHFDPEESDSKHRNLSISNEPPQRVQLSCEDLSEPTTLQQGIFSSRSSLSILDGLNFVYNSPEHFQSE